MIWFTVPANRRLAVVCVSGKAELLTPIARISADENKASRDLLLPRLRSAAFILALIRGVPCSSAQIRVRKLLAHERRDERDIRAHRL
jgi:hypothetical protein